MKVNNKQEILELLNRNKSTFSDYGIKRIGLFGSFARGEQHERSDIDLLVEFDKKKKNFKNFIKSAEYAESLLGRKVELLTPESVSPYIFPYIEKEVNYVQISG